MQKRLMKSALRLKKPFGTAKMVRLTHARYLSWEDAFEVEFEDGLSFLEPHQTIRRANQISKRAIPVAVELEPETKTGFFIHYDTGETGEISWAFIRELAPKGRNGHKTGQRFDPLPKPLSRPKAPRR